MRLVLKSAIVAVIALHSMSASALKLTNRDAADRKLIIIEGDKQSEQTVKPGEEIETCLKSCVIKLGDGEDYEFDGSEIVSLEDGLLFLDGPGDQTKVTR